MTDNDLTKANNLCEKIKVLKQALKDIQTMNELNINKTLVLRATCFNTLPPCGFEIDSKLVDEILSICNGFITNKLIEAETEFESL